MPRKSITLKFVVLTVLAVAFGIMISIGAAHLRDKHPVPIDRYAVAGSREIADLTQGSEGVDQVPSTVGASALMTRLRCMLTAGGRRRT